MLLILLILKSIPMGSIITKFQKSESKSLLLNNDTLEKENLLPFTPPVEKTKVF
jgi:hypothetical protein